jgi:hypothetical protein
MKYAIWFVRLVYAAWMIPAGLNHFFPLYPQPVGSEPVAVAVFTALWDSWMFTMVKAVELLAGVAVLLGFRMALTLIFVLPVSFTVWYWDTELQGWWQSGAIYGWCVMGCNLFLALYYWPSYKALFTRDAKPQAPIAALDIPKLFDVLQVVLGVVLVISALRYFMPFLFGSFLPLPEFTDPMALRLRTSLDASGLLAVAKFIHLAGGLMLLERRWVPFALAALVPVNVCAAFIAVIEGSPLLVLAAFAILAVNGLLALAYLPSYSGVLDPKPLAEPEGAADGENYNSIFVNPLGSASTNDYLLAAIPLLGALAVYWWIVPGLNGPTGLVTLAIPTVIFAIGLARSLTRKPAAA